MNTVLTTLLILALAIAIFFDFIRIVQYIQSKKFMDKSNKWAENKFKEIEFRQQELRKMIERLSSNCLASKKEIIKGEDDTFKYLVDFSARQYNHYKQLKEIQDTIRKIEKRK